MSAVLSPCGRYRYRLDRDVSVFGSDRVLFVMLNPSVADASKDDPTIRKDLGFADRKWSTGRLDVVNLYGWRATDPADLRRAWERGEDVIGPENDEHIAQAADAASIIVVAWGALNLCAMSVAAQERAREVVGRLRVAAAGRPLWCFGTTLGGQPRHPLMVSYSVEPHEWVEPARARTVAS